MTNDTVWAAEHFGPYLHRVKTDLATIEHPDPSSVLHGLVDQLCGPPKPRQQQETEPTWWVDPSRFTEPPEPPEPMLTRSDGQILIPAGRVSWISGLPGSGKPGWR